MKKTIASTAIALLLPIWLLAQNTLSVKVKNENGNPLIGASVHVKGSLLSGQTNSEGEVQLRNLKRSDHLLSISYLGYETQEKRVELTQSEITIVLKAEAFLTDEVIVQATRASGNAATTFKNLSKEDIAKNNMGQEVSYLLNQTPSVVVSSDAGAGIGHTGVTIRGSDAARTNVTLNGIPYNDPESLGTFWVNMPDFSSSIDNIQIQRGVGTSTNGAAAFGASINIQTNTRQDTAYAELDNSFGSYQTVKNTVKLGTGLINNKFSFDGRLSRVLSDGYMDHGDADRAADLKSFFVSGAWYGESSLLRANVFSGTQKTYQAWNGVPEELLKTDRTYNEFTYKDQTDNYLQTHYQLLYSNSLSPSLLLNGALHYTRGEGYYEEFKKGQKFSSYQLDNVEIGGETITKTDLIRQRWLRSDFYGTTYSLRYTPLSNLNLTLGGAYNIYKGDHFGEVIWAQYASNGNLGDRYYDNDATKKDFNSYLKADYRIHSVSLFADLQYRNVDYSYQGVNRDLSFLQKQVKLNFFNPKVGLSVNFDNNSLAYASVAVANKEPIRRDYTDALPGENPNPEHLTDVEAGYKINSNNFNIGINGYMMLYKDQLVTTGFINDVGAAVRENVSKSYRSGIELDAKWKPIKEFTWSAAAAFSKNIINDYTYYVDVYDEDNNGDWIVVDPKVETLKNTTIAMSPNVVLSNEFAYQPISNVEFAFISKYVGRQFLDNTASNDKSISPFFVNDLRLHYTTTFKGLKNVGLTLRVNNLFDELYEANGYTFGYYNPDGALETYNYYFPQATRNFMLGLNVRF